MNEINAVVRAGAAAAMSEKQFFEQEITAWKNSKARLDQITGERYYRGRHDILDRKRTVIGAEGRLQTVDNLPNNRIVDNQYAKMVDQKTNYLFGKPFTVKTENEAYEKALSAIFDKRFHLMLQNLCEDSLNGGIGWVYVYYDDTGKFKFRRFAPYEVLPFWKDAEHTILDCVVRVYETEVYEGREITLIEKAEIYKNSGIERYILADAALIDDVENPSSPYMTLAGKPYAWDRVPVVGFKYNDEEIPLICKVKSLQDALNVTMSDFPNTMQEDARNTIIVLSNYDGENLATFRQNLAAYGAIKVRTLDGAPGDVKTLHIEVNAENYKVLIEILKKALIENAGGFDAKDDRLGGSPNQMNILSMYSDIDLDADGTEAEWQAAFEDLMFFVNAHLANTGQGKFTGDEFEITFDRNMIMNETDVISNAKNSVGLISTETILANHPWVTDIVAEEKRLEAERQKELDEYKDALPGHEHDVNNNGGKQ
jgi:SPP1 family phage portal protein